MGVHVLCGSRVVVRKKARGIVLSSYMLHQAYPGISHMKSLARGYVWWPGIDNDVEQCVKLCESCQQNQRSPPVTRSPTPLVLAI